MSGIAFKIVSLGVRTLAKPVGVCRVCWRSFHWAKLQSQNYIKRQAREHERFRSWCVATAQAIHRVDMRLRLGLLQDAAAIDKQIAKEAAEAKAKKEKLEVPTVKTEAQTLADKAKAAQGQDPESERAKLAARKPKIRPLSEAKAIDFGATFASESFLFLVALGLLGIETWRRSGKETSRREDVAERMVDLEEKEKISRKALVELEKEILRLRAKERGQKVAKTRILPKEVYEEQEDIVDEQPLGWLPWARGLFTKVGSRSEVSEPTGVGQDGTIEKIKVHPVTRHVSEDNDHTSKILTTDTK